MPDGGGDLPTVDEIDQMKQRLAARTGEGGENR
jgi:hypothetical protein